MCSFEMIPEISLIMDHLALEERDFLLLSFFFSLELSVFVNGKFDVLLSAPVVFEVLTLSDPNTQIQTPKQNNVLLATNPLPNPKLKP